MHFHSIQPYVGRCSGLFQASALANSTERRLYSLVRFCILPINNSRGTEDFLCQVLYETFLDTTNNTLFNTKPSTKFYT